MLYFWVNQSCMAVNWRSSNLFFSELRGWWMFATPDMLIHFGFYRYLLSGLMFLEWGNIEEDVPTHISGREGHSWAVHLSMLHMVMGKPWNCFMSRNDEMMRNAFFTFWGLGYLSYNLSFFTLYFCLFMLEYYDIMLGFAMFSKLRLLFLAVFPHILGAWCRTLYDAAFLSNWKQ